MTVSTRLMATAMAIFPFSLAVVFHTGIHSVPLAIASPQLPSIAFDQYGVDLRIVKSNSTKEASFQFQNRGKTPVRITKLTASCGCMTPHLQGGRDDQIAPGGYGRILVKLQPETATPGPHSYSITVKYTDPEPREVQLALKLEIPATIWVNPPVIGVYHPRGTEPTKQVFKVVDGRGKRFEITDVYVDNEHVEAAIGESSRTASGNFEQTVHVQIAGDLPPGRSRAIVRISTTDPEVPELRATVFLEGQAATPDDTANQSANEADHTDPNQAASTDQSTDGSDSAK